MSVIRISRPKRDRSVSLATVLPKEGEEREFLCGTNGIGWPTLREASPEDLAEIRGQSIS